MMSGGFGPRGRLLAAALTTALLLFSGSAIGLAQEGGGHEGAAGLSCGDLVSGSLALTISPGAFDTPIDESDGTIRAVLTPSESDMGQTFDWEASLPVDAIIVAGGPKVMAWEYEPAARSGFGLHAPLNMEGSHYHQPKTISVCYRVEIPEIDLAVEKSDSNDPVRVGDVFEYLITATNTGEDAFVDVAIEDRVPAQVRVTGVEGCPDWDGTSRVTCSLGALAAGSSAAVTITVEAVEAGVIVNTATATATTAEGLIWSQVASEATVIEKAHDDDGGHDHDAPSCDLIGPDLVAIDVAEAALHENSVVVGDGVVAVTLSSYEAALGREFDWSSDYPIAGVITVGGPETLTFTYPPLTFSAGGLHAPLSGGETHYRGLRQAIFCYAPGPLVDVAIEMAADETRVLVGDVVAYTMVIVNHGVRPAEQVTVILDVDQSLRSVLERHELGKIAAGGIEEIRFTAEAAVADPSATVAAEVSASNEDAGVQANNTATVSIEVLQTSPVTTAPEPPETGESTSTTTTTAPEVSGDSTTTVPDSSSDTLPFTGAPVESLAMAATASICLGLLLLYGARSRVREVDLILYRQGDEPIIPW